VTADQECIPLEDERRDRRRMPESVAVAGARGAAWLADRDDGDLEDVPF
jgi:hypothetical protein